MIRILCRLSICLLLFCSCYSPRYVYSPAAHNVSFLTKKNETKLAANYSTNIVGHNSEGSKVTKNSASGLDAQAAYALNKRWFLQASYYSRKEQNDGDYSFRNQDSSILHYKRKLLETGLGYNFPIDARRNANFQLAGGIGFGRFRIDDAGTDANQLPYTRFHDARVTKFYIQPAIVVGGADVFAAAFSSRFSFIKYHGIKTDYTPTELNNYKLDSLTYRLASFWEPAFVSSFGFKKLPGLRLEGQMGLSILMSKNFVDARVFNFSAGIVLDLPRLLDRKKQPAKNAVAVHISSL
ncbi:MAG: hypothetical protein JWQ27_1358 [Ferruginibacter sp.]|nr:hypothetical protein [Ferruginibacter sp.]